MSASIDKYYSAFLASQEYLLGCDDISVPLNIYALIRQHGKIILQTKVEYQSWCLSNNKPPIFDIDDAKCFYDPNHDVYLIIYDDRKDVMRIRFTLAHELGHIVLNHLNHNTPILSREHRLNYRYMRLEGAANTFAGNLLAPPVFIDAYKHRISKFAPESIGNIFYLSLSAANKRFSDYLIWKKTMRKSRIEYELDEKLQMTPESDFLRLPAPVWEDL